MTPIIDPYDELAALFMTEERDVETPARPASAERAESELVVVGHLPVLARLWITPYGDAIARDEGPTALVRLDGDEPMIQVLRCEAGEAAAARSAASRNLHEAILSLGRSVNRWLVRPSAQSTADEIATSAVDRVTILSAADQMAVVNAYGAVKDVVASVRAAGGRMPEIGLAIVGAEGEAAASVADRIAEVAAANLGVKVPLVLTLPRMDAAIRSTYLRSFPGQARPRLGDVIDWIAEARTCGDAAPSTPAAPAIGVPSRAPIAVPRVPAAEGAAPPRLSSPSAPVAPAIPTARGTPPPGAEPAEAARTVTPVYAPPPLPAPGRAFAAPAQVEAKDDAGVREPHDNGRPRPLAAIVGGLRPLRPRCPGHEHVELAVDDRGGLHLVGREHTLRDMPVVEEWVRAHREILAMACPQEKIELAASVTCHLVADEPRRVADLHGSRFHLHVLAPVDVNGSRAWYSAPLNRPR